MSDRDVLLGSFAVVADEYPREQMIRDKAAHEDYTPYIEGKRCERCGRQTILPAVYREFQAQIHDTWDLVTGPNTDLKAPCDKCVYEDVARVADEYKSLQASDLACLCRNAYMRTRLEPRERDTLSSIAASILRYRSDRDRVAHIIDELPVLWYYNKQRYSRHVRQNQH